MALASYAFLLVFLPAALAAHALAVRYGRGRAGQLTLLLASVAFCAQAGATSLAWLAGSSAFTYLAARGLAAWQDRPRAQGRLMAAAIGVQVALLGVFKYTGFAIESWNAVFGSAIDLASPALPLGISFITFQQIAYLVEATRARSPLDPLDYACFIGFFPKLVAGPLADPGRLVPDLRAAGARWPSAHDLGLGLTWLAVGLFKKVMIADELGECADPVFSATASGAVGAGAAWLGALAYTLQIYFDFSGYSDMALGAARCFGIRLPLNFDSPYQATDIGDFWRRWHMTLTRFLTRYLYTPIATPLTRWALGREASPAVRFAATVAVPSVVTFAIAGLWHGAGFTFVVFGLLHGVYLTVHQGWRELRRARGRRASGSVASRLAAWALTFACVMVAFVVFRAASLAEAWALLWAMVGVGEGARSGVGSELFERRDVLLVAAAAAVALLAPNVAQVLREHDPALDAPRPTAWPDTIRWRWSPGPRHAFVVAALWIAGLAALGEVSSFIYYRF